MVSSAVSWPVECQLNPNEIGIIAGSLTEPTLLVRGRDLSAQLNSIPHGLGRRQGRGSASREDHDIMRLAKSHGIQLSGSGAAEHPLVYKTPDSVFRPLADSICQVGTFVPRIVRMTNSSEPSED